jgi:hypothetical protein
VDTILPPSAIHYLLSVPIACESVLVIRLALLWLIEIVIAIASALLHFLSYVVF